jgi:hypothetical protein
LVWLKPICTNSVSAASKSQICTTGTPQPCAWRNSALAAAVRARPVTTSAEGDQANTARICCSSRAGS